MSTKDVKRLHSTFQPENYQLFLTPDREGNVFSGRVTVAGQKVQRPSRRLVFHQNGLKIVHARIIKHDKKGDHVIDVARINHHKRYDEVRLHTEQLLYPGQYTVEMEFYGQITPPMNGMYRCTFKHDGREKHLIATQFESHHAREVFPCVDEPEAKATFDLTLVTPAGETVLANTPVKDQTKSGSRLETTFETTPKMSTYLLAFVYGELDYREARAKNGTLIRTYATPDQVKFTEFALDVAVKCLDYYDEYFGVPYPLEKCDLIALPDFAAGAMENWGCITFREHAILMDPENTSLASKQWVAMVVAHELAHQWFGNLVTMRWWTDLWLNEGFASWIEYLALNHLFPQWEMWTQFAVDEQQRAFKLDALEHTHPIEVPVHHPDEIRTIFDTISYSKGASVIHMLHQYLGPEAFRDGLRHYLKRHAYGNTDTIDLWQALEEVSKKPVKDFMHAWTSQSGFPVLTIGPAASGLRLEQNRFYLNPEARKETKQPTVWPIPLLFNEQINVDVLESREQVVADIPEWLKNQLDSSQQPFVETTGAKPHRALLANDGSAGFYLTQYRNPSHFAALTLEVQHGSLSPLNRLQLLHDTFELAKAGYSYTDTEKVLKLLEAYAHEDNNAVWDVMSRVITTTRAVMDNEQLRELMKPFIIQLTATQLKRLGWEKKKNESHFDSLLRPTIIGLAASADEPAVIKECLERFDRMKKPEDIPPDLRGAVYATVVRKRNDTDTFDKLFALHEASTLAEERLTITAALTSFKDPKLIKRALSLIKTDSVRLQDASYWVVYSFMNRHAKTAAWQWMTKEWGWLEKNLGTDMSFSRFPLYAASAFSDHAFLKKFKAFYLPRKSPALERSINQGIEVITWQSAWRERDFDTVQTFFKNRQ